MKDGSTASRETLNPAYILEIGSGFWKSKVLLTAVGMRLFTRLGGEAEMKVLIIDDNEQARRMIKHYLRDQPHDFVECEDGSDALSAYTDFLPDWVLMDLEMKKMDGIAATKEIMHNFPAARILICTQYDDAGLRTEATKAGASGYVAKDNLFGLREFFQ